MLTLYYAPGACSMAAHIVLEESGEKYEEKKVDLAGGEQRTASYLKINPLGRVPVLLLDSGEPLAENTAILPYLGKRFNLWPIDTIAEAKALKFLRCWGEDIGFINAHGAAVGPDDVLYLTDDFGHAVRKCTTDGKVVLTIGTPKKPAPAFSGDPFNRSIRASRRLWAPSIVPASKNAEFRTIRNLNSPLHRQGLPLPPHPYSWFSPTSFKANSPNGSALTPLVRTKSADSNNERSRSRHNDSIRAVRFTAGPITILEGQSLNGASFTAVEQLRQHIDAFIAAYNETAEPFIWIKKKVHQRRFKNRRVTQL
jgi:hypothetical protein